MSGPVRVPTPAQAALFEVLSEAGITDPMALIAEAIREDRRRIAVKSEQVFHDSQSEDVRRRVFEVEVRDDYVLAILTPRIPYDIQALKRAA